MPLDTRKLEYALKTFGDKFEPKDSVYMGIYVADDGNGWHWVKVMESDGTIGPQRRFRGRVRAWPGVHLRLSTNRKLYGPDELVIMGSDEEAYGTQAAPSMLENHGREHGWLGLDEMLHIHDYQIYPLRAQPDIAGVQSAVLPGFTLVGAQYVQLGATEIVDLSSYVSPTPNYWKYVTLSIDGGANINVTEGAQGAYVGIDDIPLPPAGEYPISAVLLRNGDTNLARDRFVDLRFRSIGTQGAGGSQGPQGAGGAQGPQGAQGAGGAQGAQGAGSQGTQGPQGPQGGSGGPQGPQGATGAQGPQGSQGAQGASGSQGSQGPQGAQGAQGSGTQGAQGPQGSQGPQGASGGGGSQGSQGATGAQGPQGPQGSQGASGSQGPQGSQGAQGTQGPQGAQGAQGAQGSSAGGAIYLLTSGARVGATAGRQYFTNSIESGGILRSTGAASGLSGKGIEIEWDATQGDILAYDRDGSVYLPLRLRGSSIEFMEGVSTIALIDGGTLSVTGDIRASVSNSGWLPFTMYVASTPVGISNDGTEVFSSTIGRSMTLRSCAYAVLVDNPNNGANFWYVGLYDSSGAFVAGSQADTSAMGSATWVVISTSGLSTALTTANDFVYVKVDKSGNPGAITLAGPMCFVS